MTSARATWMASRDLGAPETPGHMIPARPDGVPDRLPHDELGDVVGAVRMM
ncbi:hypothetical protein AB0N06_19640 [Streptomyces sp. NPDC051020]|uniref:hypothetical protein n=1 Tax=Streptomyces sp. NPDC051020 TaxID=3155409 RepID=UPI00343F67CB